MFHSTGHDPWINAAMTAKALGLIAGHHIGVNPSQRTTAIEVATAAIRVMEARRVLPARPDHPFVHGDHTPDPRQVPLTADPDFAVADLSAVAAEFDFHAEVASLDEHRSALSQLVTIAATPMIESARDVGLVAFA